MNSLHLIDRHIESQSINEVSSIITPEEIRLLGYDNIQEFVDTIKKINQLQLHVGSTLDMLDIDDTLSSRFNTLQHKDLSDKRGELGNKDIVENQGGYKKYAEKNYNSTSRVDTLVKILLNEFPLSDSIILTAGVNEFQECKLEQMELIKPDKDVLIVDKTSEKPKKLFEYIINDLGYIPNYINIYDDRVTYFKLLGPIIAKILGSKLVVNEVVLSTSNTTKIQTINQSIYQKEAA